MSGPVRSLVVTQATGEARIMTGLAAVVGAAVGAFIMWFALTALPGAPSGGGGVGYLLLWIGIALLVPISGAVTVWRCRKARRSWSSTIRTCCVVLVLLLIVLCGLFGLMGIAAGL